MREGCERAAKKVCDVIGDSAKIEGFSNVSTLFLSPDFQKKIALIIYNEIVLTEMERAFSETKSQN